MKVFLVGAAYVSKVAANEAKEVMISTHPRCVLLELDKVLCYLAHDACHCYHMCAMLNLSYHQTR